MTATRFREIQTRLGLTAEQMALALRMGPEAASDVIRYAHGAAAIPGPVGLAMEALGDGWRPANLRALDPPRLAA